VLITEAFQAAAAGYQALEPRYSAGWVPARILNMPQFRNARLDAESALRRA
jgi:hypothetical protein